LIQTRRKFSQRIFSGGSFVFWIPIFGSQEIYSNPGNPLGIFSGRFAGILPAVCQTNRRSREFQIFPGNPGKLPGISGKSPGISREFPVIPGIPGIHGI
jgi:hypothetical protein